MIDELDGALHDLYPVPADGPASLRRVRRRVLPRKQPRLLVAAAAAVVLVAVVTAVVVRGTGPDGAMVEVAQILDTAADAQVRTVDEPVPAGWYRYLATHARDTGYVDQVAVLMGTRRETWVPADPAGWWYTLRVDTGERNRLAGTAEQAEAAGLGIRSAPERLSGRCGAFFSPVPADPCTADGNWQDPTVKFIAGLPRDPARLYHRLRADTRGHGQEPDQEVLVYVADALRSGLLPADLRAALYEALKRLPTLEITERAATLDGRTGSALGITAAGEQREIVIDLTTGAFIGERRRLAEARGGIPAGTVIGSSTVRYGIVPKPWQRPAR